MAIRPARKLSCFVLTLRLLEFVRQLRRRLESHPRGPSWPIALSTETCVALEAKTLGKPTKGLLRSAAVGLRHGKHLLNASDRISKGRDRKNVRPTLKLQTPGHHRGTIQNGAGGEMQHMINDVEKGLSLPGSTLSAMASNNKHFLLQQTGVNLEALTLNETIQSLAVVHDAISVLEACRVQYGDGWIIAQGQEAGLHFDELFFANYEHLLLRLRTQLVDELARKVLEALLLGGHDKRQHRMLSWFAEFSDKPRPLSTFPWTIKPSLAVLWGVCWMFYNPVDQNQNAAGRSNLRVSQTAFLQNIELPEWGPPGAADYFSFGLELLGTQTTPAAPQLANEAVDLRLRNAEPWAPNGGHNLSVRPRPLSRVAPGPGARPSQGLPATTYCPPFPAALHVDSHPDFARDLLPAPPSANATLAVYPQFNNQHWHPLPPTSLPQRPARHLTTTDIPSVRVTQVPGSADLAAPQPGFAASDYTPLYSPSVPGPEASSLHLLTGYMDTSYPHNANANANANTPAATMGNCTPADVSPTVALPGPRHERTPSLNSTNIPTPVSLACPRSPLHSPAEDRRPSISSVMGHRRRHSDDSSSQSGDDLGEARKNHAFKRAEEPPKNSEGKMVCKYQECASLTFERKCEWSKHMDKHDRPYKCAVKGCEKLQGFTYSGGLLRHEREVHKMHGGTKKSLFCPFADCKRSSGAGFTRKENLAEHIRRVHRRTSMSVDMGHLIIPRRVSMEDSSPADIHLPSEPPFQRIVEERAEEETKLSLKRKPSDAGLSADGDDDLRVELKRLRRENEEKDSRLRQLEAAVMALQQRR